MKRLGSTNQAAIAYCALASPAIATVLLLAGTYLLNLDTALSAIVGFTPPLEFLAELTTILGLLLPGLAVASCCYGVFAFRPALIVATNSIFYLFVTTALGTVNPNYALLVVTGSFTTLVGFNYSRAFKVQGERRVLGESIGQRRFQFATFGFDFALPVAVVIGSITLVAVIMDVIRIQLTILPQPLSTLGTLYLESRLYVILTLLSVAGALVWVLRQFFEPILLRFTLTRQDAREYALQALDADLRREYWHAKWKPRVRVRDARFNLVLLCSSIMILVLLAGPNGPIELLKTVGLATPGRDAYGYDFNYNAKLAARTFDHGVSWFENILKELFKILWG